MSKTYNELSQVVITVSPEDIDGLPYTPITARYRVDDCRTRKNLVPWTAVTFLSTAIQIVVPGTANAIITDRNTPESKILTWNSDKDLATQHYAEYEYRVKDLGFAQVT